MAPGLMGSGDRLQAYTCVLMKQDLVKSKATGVKRRK